MANLKYIYKDSAERTNNTVIFYSEQFKFSGFINCKKLLNLFHVDHCPKLTILNLEGFDQLTDLAVEYIVTGNNEAEFSGLKLLEEIVLPKKSFVTEFGLQVKLQLINE